MRHHLRVVIHRLAAHATTTDEGRFVAVVAGVDDTFTEWPNRRVRIAPDAFDSALAARRSWPVMWEHDWDSGPIGVADTATVNAEGLVMSGQIWTDDPLGRRAHRAMLAGAVDEWSIGFVPESETYDAKTNTHTYEKIDLIEVSVVLRGANPATRTVEVHRRVHAATPVHDTDVVDRPWDGPATVAALEAVDVAIGNAMFAWRDPDLDPTTKQAWKLPHHELVDGRPGPANLRAVRNALARLSQSDIPRADWPGVERHLRRHLDRAMRDSFWLPHLHRPAVRSLYATVYSLRRTNAH